MSSVKAETARWIHKIETCGIADINAKHRYAMA
jgi:hypothetical protein